MPPDPQPDPRYLRGVALFNGGDYFAAHEEWEHLWRGCPPADRRFYQSLIQAAVALYHWGRNNPAGAARLLASGRGYMAAYRPAHRGLAVDRFWAAVEAAMTPGPGDHPQIALDPPPAAWPDPEGFAHD